MINILKFEDKRIEEYINKMSKWIQANLNKSEEEVNLLFQNDQNAIIELFDPYPETIFHDDPAKWAELFAIRWGLLKEVEMELLK